MKTTITKYALALAAVVSLGSCGKWLDINDNPLSSKQPDPGYLFNFAVVSNCANRQSGDMFIPLAMAGQLIADGGNSDQGAGFGEVNYRFSDTRFSNTWTATYADGLNNVALASKYAAEKGRTNAVAQCSIYSAFLFYQATMMFGDVPYAEALQNPSKYGEPKFDSQKAVLEGCIALLDEAIKTADSGNGTGAITGFDIFYGGDMTKWANAARSLKLQILLTLYNREPERAAQIRSVVEAGGLVERGGDMKFPFYDQAGSENPNYRLNKRIIADNIGNTDITKQGSAYLFFAHDTVMDPMVQFDDPRLPVYFYKNVEGGYRSLANGEFAELANDKNIYGFRYMSSPVNAKRFYTPTMNDVLVSYQEAQFNLAEVYARGIGVAADMTKAQEAFANAVGASCEFWGVAAGDASAFASSLPALNSLDQNGALELINNQRRIDFMSRPFEAFCNQRRTGMPVLTTPATSPYKNLLFNRFPYPSREYGVNSNVPNPMPQFYEPMWFQN